MSCVQTVNKPVRVCVSSARAFCWSREYIGKIYSLTYLLTYLSTYCSIDSDSYLSKYSEKW